MIIVCNLLSSLHLLVSTVRAKFSTLALVFIISISVPVVGQAEPNDLSTPAHSSTSDKTVLIFGDSISAAYGIEREQGWVELLRRRLAAQNYDYQVINASVSGETTGGGVVRLPKTLQIHQPHLVVLELGGNDGLRGYPTDKIKSNLTRMIKNIKATGADILLVGMVLPPNYGRRYTTAFEKLFTEIAKEFDISFLPFLLEGVTTRESLLQRDGIHPTPEAQALLLDDLWPQIQLLLERQRLNRKLLLSNFSQKTMTFRVRMRIRGAPLPHRHEPIHGA